MRLFFESQVKQLVRNRFVFIVLSKYIIDWGLVLRKRSNRYKNRRRVFGVSERPRLCVNVSLRYIFLQLIDDVCSKTILSVLGKSLKDGDGNVLSSNMKSAFILGEVFGRRIKDYGVLKIVYDRRQKVYTGVLKSIADGLRQSGIVF